MKKYFLVLFLLLAPVVASAAITQNLYYGMVGNSQVKQLQQYLIGKGFLTSTATGSFYSLTLSAVKKYQASEHINPTGYVGALTRAAINGDTSASSTSAAAAAPTVVAPTTAPTSSATAPAPATAAPLTGSLDVSQTASYASQSVAVPQSAFKLADFTVKNDTTEAVNLSSLEIGVAVNSDPTLANVYIANLYAVYGTAKTTTLGTATGTNDWPINSLLPVGQTVDVSVYGDINSLIPKGATIATTILASGASAVSATKVYTNSNVAFAGQTTTVAASSLAVSEDSTTPASQLVAVNQRVVAGKFQFVSTGSSYTVSELKFVVPNPNTAATIGLVPPVADAVLTDTATGALLSPKPVPVFYDGTNYILDFTGTIPVALNTTRSVTLNYDLSSTINSNTTNLNIAPVLAYVKAADNKGTVIDGAAANYTDVATVNGGIALPAAGVTVNALYPFKSIPTFASVPVANTGTANGSSINLYGLSISASKNADVSVKQLTFTINLNDPAESNPRLNAFTFLKDTKDYTGAVNIGTIVDYNYVSLTTTGAIGTGITNTVVVTFDQEETIPAGTTQTYILKAQVNNFAKSSDSISVSMPSDTTAMSGGSYMGVLTNNLYYGLSQTSRYVAVTPENIVWSDKSSVSPNQHSEYSADWYNGFQVPGLPLAAQTVTAQ